MECGGLNSSLAFPMSRAHLMRNIRLTIEYDGTNYQGWQRQKNTHQTLQEIIEKTAKRILQERVRLVASGRTDAGVHARGQVANFKTNAKIPLKNLKQALNSLLPDDIVITEACEEDLKFHARFDAKSKIYRYAILNQRYPSALWRNDRGLPRPLCGACGAGFWAKGRQTKQRPDRNTDRAKRPAIPVRHHHIVAHFQDYSHLLK